MVIGLYVRFYIENVGCLGFIYGNFNVGGLEWGFDISIFKFFSGYCVEWLGLIIIL